MFRRRPSTRARPTQIVILLPASVLEAPPTCDESKMSAGGYFDCELESGNHQFLQACVAALQELGVFIMILDPMQPDTPMRARGREHALYFGSVGRYRYLKTWPFLIKRVYRDNGLLPHVRLDIRDMAYQLDHRKFPIMQGHRLMVHDREEHTHIGDISHTLDALAEELRALRSQRRRGVRQQHSSSVAQRPPTKKTMVCCGTKNKARLHQRQESLPATPPDYSPRIKRRSVQQVRKRPGCCLSANICGRNVVAEEADKIYKDAFGLQCEGSPCTPGG